MEMQVWEELKGMGGGKKEDELNNMKDLQKCI